MTEVPRHRSRLLQRFMAWATFAVASLSAGFWAKDSSSFWSITQSFPQPIVRKFDWVTAVLAKPFLVASVAEAEEQLALYRAIVICAGIFGLAWFMVRRIYSRVANARHQSAA